MEKPWIFLLCRSASIAGTVTRNMNDLSGTSFGALSTVGALVRIDGGQVILNRNGSKLTGLLTLHAADAASSTNLSHLERPCRGKSSKPEPGCQTSPAQ